jgi:predicted nucleic acid-binding protein
MSFFFDTNVLVYCTDTTDPKRQTQARKLVAQSSASGDGVISTQVLIELFNVLTRKQKMLPAAARDLALAYATNWPLIQSDFALVGAALEKAVKHQLSIFDAMVVEAALRADAKILYSEDMQHGQRYGSLTVMNPFL